MDDEEPEIEELPAVELRDGREAIPQFIQFGHSRKDAVAAIVSSFAHAMSIAGVPEELMAMGMGGIVQALSVLDVTHDEIEEGFTIANRLTDHIDRIRKSGMN